MHQLLERAQPLDTPANAAVGGPARPVDAWSGAPAERSRESSPGPFAPPLNALLSQAFGQSLAGVTLSTGEDDKNKLIRANGHTKDRHISLGSHIVQDLSDPLSMEVIAHETAHALAGSHRPQTLLNEPGDAGETTAHETGRLFRNYAESGFSGAQPRLQPAHGGQAVIHRHEIQGPFGIKDPAHETMSTVALRRAGLIKEDETFSSPAAWEYVRGAMWNDDPENMFFNSNRLIEPSSPLAANALGAFHAATGNGRPGDFSTGAEWLLRFKKYEKQAAADKQFGVDAPLLGRTHFGDMSPLHGMAGQDNESRESTLKTMMMWSEFSSKVAMGKIPADAQLSDIQIPGFEMFSKDKNFQGKTVAEFFGCDKTGGDVKKRAMGSLMHMVQDSYAGGHAEREDLGGGRKGNLMSFHAYSHQDHNKHGGKDQFQGGYFPNEAPEQQIARLDGGEDAVEQCTQLLILLNKKDANWDDVKAHLENKTFALSPQKEGTQEKAGAGPGKDFEKTPEKKRSWLGKLWDGAKDGAINTLIEVGNFGLDAKEWVGETVTDAWQGAKKGISTAWDFVTEKVGEAGRGIHNGLKSMGRWLGHEGTETWHGLKRGFGGAKSFLKEAASEAGSGLLSTAEDLGLNRAGAWLGSKAHGAVDAVRNSPPLLDYASEKMSAAGQGIRHGVGEAVQLAQDKGSAAWDGTTQAARGAVDWTGQAVDRAGQGLVQGAGDALDWAGHKGGEAWTGIADGAQGAARWTGARFGEAGHRVAQGTGDALRWVGNQGDALWEGLKERTGLSTPPAERSPRLDSSGFGPEEERSLWQGVQGSGAGLEPHAAASGAPQHQKKVLTPSATGPLPYLPRAMPPRRPAPAESGAP